MSMICFSVNLGDLTEEQGQRFLQDIKEMYRKYQEDRNVNMIADYFWMMKRNYPQHILSTARSAVKSSTQSENVITRTHELKEKWTVVEM